MWLLLDDFALPKIWDFCDTGAISLNSLGTSWRVCLEVFSRKSRIKALEEQYSLNSFLGTAIES